ncbi:hypothetical protein [Deinococcus hopiensis]|uniref:Uncharacterized protein n=1 Tax=Deinococcus hopiensis KR-140 TaxID=695939 RepID=A0A1W1VJS8_9DEIO|nr:hypothetical protein [Deinococcus hopiensis]SMB93311.1 hypothetical protein SAMN00790413_01930 [Deinococcus hopiensis KR-140]
MSGIVDDLHSRLTAALGSSIPVLRPEQQQEPLAGRKPGQSGGLSVYLTQHPQGYVQLYNPGPGFTINGWSDTQTLQVDTIAPTDALALGLAERVRSLIGTTPRTGKRRQVVTPPFIANSTDGSARAVTTYNLRSAHPR